jgi:hypothetical protein
MCQVAVKLEHHIFRYPRLLVQSIHILRNHSIKLAHFFELSNNISGGIGLGLGYGQLAASQEFPNHFSDLAVGKEPVDGKIFRIIFAPDPIRTSEIRNTGFGADAGTGKEYNPFRFCDKLGYLLYLLVY